MSAISWAPNFQNGTPPDGQCLDVNGQGMLLHWEAARQFWAFAAAFEAVFGIPLTISEAGRSLARQEFLFDGWSRRLPGFYPASQPGESSHGEFTAIDINSWVYGGSAGTERHDWLVENGPAYGWDWYLVGEPSGEAWHFNYRFGLKTITADANGVYNITSLEDIEIMGALDEIKKAITDSEERILAATGRGGSVVYWVPAWNRTYQVAPNLIKHHANGVERDNGYVQAGQLDELAIQADEFNIERVFWNNGITHIPVAKIKTAPAGQVFRPDTKIDW